VAGDTANEHRSDEKKEPKEQLMNLKATVRHLCAAAKSEPVSARQMIEIVNQISQANFLKEEYEAHHRCAWQLRKERAEESLMAGLRVRSRMTVVGKIMSAWFKMPDKAQRSTVEEADCCRRKEAALSTAAKHAADKIQRQCPAIGRVQGPKRAIRSRNGLQPV
jgi:hypothetical protein